MTYAETFRCAEHPRYVQPCWKCHWTPEDIQHDKLMLLHTIIHGCAMSTIDGFMESANNDAAREADAIKRVERFIANAGKDGLVSTGLRLADLAPSEWIELEDHFAGWPILHEAINAALIIAGEQPLPDPHERESPNADRAWRPSSPIRYPEGWEDYVAAPDGCKRSSISLFDVRVLRRLRGTYARDRSALLGMVDDAVYEFGELISGEPLDMRPFRECWRRILDLGFIEETRHGWALTPLGEDASYADHQASQNASGRPAPSPVPPPASPSRSEAKCQLTPVYHEPPIGWRQPSAA